MLIHEAPLNILKYKDIYRDTRFICSMLVRVTKVQQDLSADICMVHRFERLLMKACQRCGENGNVESLLKKFILQQIQTR